MVRTQFTFYESFFTALRRIRRKSDRADAYDAICAYALYGTEPDLDKLSDSAAIAFSLVRPNLDASRRKAKSGKAGGSWKQNESRPEAKPKQEEAAGEKENEKENEIEKENENEIENECYLPAPSAPEKKQARSIPTLEQVREAAEQRGCPELAKPFFDYYAAAGWRDSEGKPVRSWQQKLVAWQMREEKASVGTGRKGAKDPMLKAGDIDPESARRNLERMRKYREKTREGDGT